MRRLIFVFFCLFFLTQANFSFAQRPAKEDTIKGPGLIKDKSPSDKFLHQHTPFKNQITTDSVFTVIHGIVKDVSSVPLSGVSIMAWQDGKMKAYTETGADGRYSLSIIKEPIREHSNSYEIIAGKQGFVSDKRTLDIGFSGVPSLDVNFTLLLSAGLQGVVIGEDGKSPLEGAWVNVLKKGEKMTYAVTKADGTYSIAQDIPAGSYTITAGIQGFISDIKRDVQLIAEQITTLDFNVTTSAVVQGTVTVGSEPAPSSTQIGIWQDGVLLYPVSPDGQGHYILSAELPTGLYDIAAGISGFISDIKHDVALTAGATATLDFILSQSATIKGRITDEYGHPAPADTYIGIWQNGEMIYYGNPDARGNYALSTELPTGTYDITVGRSGFVSKKEKDVALTVGEITTLDFILSTSARLQGKVSDLTGGPITSPEGYDAYIALWQRGKEISYAQADADGNYVVDQNISEGEYDITVGRVGFCSQVKRGVLIHPGEILDFDFKLERSAGMLGMLIEYPSLQPISAEGLWLSFYKAEKMIAYTPIKADSSFFIYWDLPTGIYDMYIYPSGYRAGRLVLSIDGKERKTDIPTPVKSGAILISDETIKDGKRVIYLPTQLIAGNMYGINIELEQSAGIQGTVTDSTGQPLKDVTVEVDYSGRFMMSTATDINGHYIANSNLFSGPHFAVIAIKKGYTQIVETFVAAAYGEYPEQNFVLTKLPEGTININNGDSHTDRREVQLQLTSDDAINMRFSEDGSTWSAPEPFSTTKTLTLTPGDGVKTVYVQYQDDIGNWSEKFSDVISLEMTLPLIDEIVSSVNLDTDNNYHLNSMVLIEVTTIDGATDIASGTVQITSSSTGYDSSVKPLTISISEDKYKIFYHWDTQGLPKADDYIVQATLTDTSGHIGPAGADLVISLNYSPPLPKKLVTSVDIGLPTQGDVALQIVRAYDMSLNINEIMGYGWVHNFMMRIEEFEDGLVKLLEANGEGTFFKPNGDGTYNAPVGDFRVLTKNEFDNNYELRLKDGTAYRFDETGKLMTISDRNQNVLTLDYTGDDVTALYIDTDTIYRIYESGWLDWQYLQFNYYTSGHIDSINDSSGRIVSYFYDEDNLWYFTNAIGDRTYYNYDENHNLTTISDPLQHETIFTIDAENDILVSVEKEGGINKVTYGYSTEIPQFTVTNSLGKTHTYTYNNSGQVTKIIDPLSSITEFTYDADLNLKSIKDAYLRDTAFAYDERGNMLSSTDYLGNTTSWTYDDTFNQVTSITNPREKTTEFFYDERGNLERKEDALDNLTRYYYDSYGNLEKIVDALGSETEFVYDDRGLVTNIFDPLDNETIYEYDNKGNRTKIIDANGGETVFEYDDLNRLIHQVDALENDIYYDYDNVGNLTGITDDKGNKITQQFDSADRLIKRIYPDTTPDPADNLKEIFNYDSEGNLTSKVDRSNNTITYQYDDLNRLRKKILPGSIEHNFTYDKMNNILTAQTPDWQIGFTYDELYRLDNVTYPNNWIISYDYDVNSNRTQMIYPDGTTVKYTYDDLDRLEFIKDAQENTIAQYVYDDIGRRTSRLLGNGITSNYEYYDNSWLMNLTNIKTTQDVVSQFAYQYDSVGNRRYITTLSGTAEYLYDGINQLLAVIKPGSVTNYYLDSLGNRVYVFAGGGMTSYASNYLNQYTKVGPSNFTYDNNGNLTFNGVDTYSYDYENQLLNVKRGVSSLASYKYDALGKRFYKNTPTGTIYYLYDGDDVIMEKNPSGTTLATYIYGAGIDEVLVMKRQGNDYYYSQDGLGSVVNITNSSEGLVESYEYDAYGLPSITSAIGNPYMFTGREYEPETSLYFYRARYYDPKIGRFISVDPIGLSGGINLYTYVENNPINSTDPSGLGQFGKRGLGGLGYIWIPFLSSNPISDFFNIELAHEQYIFSNGTNIGFGPSGLFPETDFSYHMSGQSYDDNIMQHAIEVIRSENYNFWGGYQCQNWSDVARDVYGSLSQGGKFVDVGDFSIYAPNSIPNLLTYQHQGFLAELLHFIMPWLEKPMSMSELVKTYQEYMFSLTDLTGAGAYEPTFIQFPKGDIQAGREIEKDKQVAESKDLVAKIQMPFDGCIVRAHTPVFGVAYGKDFARYIVEYGEGKNPKEWHIIKESDTPEMGSNRIEEIFSTDKSIEGNLGLWDTGLTEYTYWTHPKDHPINLNGEYTLKLTVWDKAGRKVEDRVLVDVGRVLSNVYKGIAESSDGKVKLCVPEWSLSSSSALVSIKDIPHKNIPIPKGHKLEGEIYQIREPGTSFKNDAFLEFSYKGLKISDKHLGRLGIFKFDETNSEWNPAESLILKDEEILILPTKILQPNDKYYALFIAPTEMTKILETREEIFASEENIKEENSFQLVKTADNDFIKKVNMPKFDVREYPLISFDYKMSENTKVNLLVKVNDRWYDIVFTDTPKNYDGTNLYYLTTLKDIKSDNNWYSVTINIKELLERWPEKLIVAEIAFADWDETGFMKLVPGVNSEGAALYVKNFKVSSVTDRKSGLIKWQIGTLEENPEFKFDKTMPNSYFIQDFLKAQPFILPQSPSLQMNFILGKNDVYSDYILRMRLASNEGIKDSVEAIKVSFNNKDLAKIKYSGGSNDYFIFVPKEDLLSGENSLNLELLSGEDILRLDYASFTKSNGSLWSIGVNDKSSAEFSHEMLCADDFYVGAPEEKFARALAQRNKKSRIHFYLDEAQCRKSYNLQVQVASWDERNLDGVTFGCFVNGLYVDSFKTPSLEPNIYFIPTEGLLKEGDNTISLVYKDGGEWIDWDCLSLDVLPEVKDKNKLCSIFTEDAFAEDESQNSILIDDFEGGSELNYVGGKSGTFADNIGGYCYVYYHGKPLAEAFGGKGYSLVLDYDTSKKGMWSGYWMDLNNINLMDFNYLSFWVKGANAGERFKVGLKGPKNSKFESKVSVDSYLENGVSRQWQKVRIPLKEFVSINSWRAMGMLSFGFEYAIGSGKGAVYLDEIRFEK